VKAAAPQPFIFVFNKNKKDHSANHLESFLGLGRHKMKPTFVLESICLAEGNLLLLFFLSFLSTSHLKHDLKFTFGATIQKGR
jgi:hypothetical protein